jgi:hypothetical protein
MSCGPVGKDQGFGEHPAAVFRVEMRVGSACDTFISTTQKTSIDI